MLSQTEIQRALHAARVVPLDVANPHGPLGLEQLAGVVAWARGAKLPQGVQRKDFRMPIAHCSAEVAKVVRYEINMFQHSCKFLWLEDGVPFMPGKIVHRGTGDTDESLRHESVCLESFLLHVRVLRDFFYGKKKYPDDVTAEDFIPGWQTPPIGKHLADKVRLDKTLAHLTTTRVGYKQTHPRWEVTEIHAELEPVIEAFLVALPEDMKQWFEDDDLQESGRLTSR